MFFNVIGNILCLIADSTKTIRASPSSTITSKKPSASNLIVLKIDFTSTFNFCLQHTLILASCFSKSAEKEQASYRVNVS